MKIITIIFKGGAKIEVACAGYQWGCNDNEVMQLSFSGSDTDFEFINLKEIAAIIENK